MGIQSLKTSVVLFYLFLFIFFLFYNMNFRPSNLNKYHNLNFRKKNQQPMIPFAAIQHFVPYNSWSYETYILSNLFLGSFGTYCLF